MSRVVILGHGVEGRSAERYFREKGIEPIILQNDEPFDFREDDCVVKSPGIRLDHPWVKAAKNLILPVEIGLSQLKGKVLGITGSNGKTTTVQMVAHVTGAVACGNVGMAVLDALEGDLHVVELSSFQLASMGGGPYLDAAAILNITPNHLDWHTSFDDYRQAKMRIGTCLKPGAPLFTEFFPEIVERLFRKRYREGEFSAALHDWKNMAAALLLCRQVGVSDEQFMERMLTFKKAPHRLEFIATIEGVDFINDSKATSVDAVKSALASMKKPVHLIAGGVDKGGSFRELQEFEVLQSVFAIGEAAKRIEAELQGRCPVTITANLFDGVHKARLAAKKGECVLLSPGCSSYDQFLNYQDRGECFRQILLNEGKR